MPQPIGHWNPERMLWETDRFDLLSEHSEPFSETWPTSGSMRSGSAYALPTSAPRTGGSGSSSPRRLPTPEAKLADSGPDYARAGREGSGGDDLATSIARMLPTPVTTDAEQSRRHTTTTGRSHTGTTLTDALLPGLLPTPSAAMRNDSETAEVWQARYTKHASKTDGTATRAGMPLEILAQLLDPSSDRTPES